MIDPTDHVARALTVRCEKCNAAPGQMCRSNPPPSVEGGVHARRVFMATEGRRMPDNPLDIIADRRRRRDDD